MTTSDNEAKAWLVAVGKVAFWCFVIACVPVAFYALAACFAEVFGWWCPPDASYRECFRGHPNQWAFASTIGLVFFVAMVEIVKSERNTPKSICTARLDFPYVSGTVRCEGGHSQRYGHEGKDAKGETVCWTTGGDVPR